MTAGTLPPPGTQYGPCPQIVQCEHRDCACTRRMAEHRCRLCGEPIGYDRRYYRDSASANAEHSVHASCLEAEVAS